METPRRGLVRATEKAIRQYIQVRNFSCKLRISCTNALKVTHRTGNNSFRIIQLVRVHILEIVVIVAVCILPLDFIINLFTRIFSSFFIFFVPMHFTSLIFDTNHCAWNCLIYFCITIIHVYISIVLFLSE